MADVHLGGLGRLQVSLPVVDNNRKIVGALSVVGEKFSKILARFAKISEIFEKNRKREKSLHFWKIPKKFNAGIFTFSIFFVRKSLKFCKFAKIC